MNLKTILANTNGQHLKEHSIAIAIYGHLLLKSLNFKQDIEKEISNYIIYSALLHDIGKVSKSFQDYILSKNSNSKSTLMEVPMDAESSRSKTFKGPFHNEISWAYIANLIDFQNNRTKEIVRHSVYWHHPANCKEREDKLEFENSKQIFDGVQKKLEEDPKILINNMYSFVHDMFDSFSEYNRKNFKSSESSKLPELKENPRVECIEAIQCPKFFEHKLEEIAFNAKKQLCLNLLLEADREISSWTLDKLENFLKNPEPPQKIENRNLSISEDLDNNKKSKEQYDLAQKMVNKNLSVCGVDPAGGKTSVSLYWWNHSNNKKSSHNTAPLMVALPRQHQATGLFASLQEDCKRIYNNQNIKIEAVFNGKRQYENWSAGDSDLLDSDINIMIFDRFLSPYYKRSQSSEFIKMLGSHLILDEFHEFKNLSKMIPALKEILTIRSWLESGVKTLMLSGTPEPSLLKFLNIEKNQIFSRSELSSRENHKFKMFIEESSVNKQYQFIPDCLYSFLRVDSCQKIFAHFFKDKHYTDKIKIIHTYFTSQDKTELITKILAYHGTKNADSLSEKSVITSKMLQSSYNLNFNKAMLELSQPYMDCQTAGRINRFENKQNAEIHFFYNQDSESFFTENRAGFKEIHQKWKEHIISFIQKQKGQFITIRQLMEVYDDFWSDDNIDISLKLLKQKQQKAIEDLNKYFPKRFSIKNKTPTSSSINSLFRGESRLLSACVVDDNGNVINQLHGENLLNESRSWSVKKISESMTSVLRAKDKCKKANKILEEEIFEYNKYSKHFGFKAERPLLCSHWNQDIDQELSKHLFDSDEETTNHRVYNGKFGLVKKSLLKNDN